MMKKITLILLFIIFVTGAVLRFYRLSSDPPHLNWDEASLGYNALSILTTGKDEFGQSMPLVFRSFGDYKPPLYIYLTVPSIALFGFNDFAVRFPSAFLGTLTILVVFGLVRVLFKKDSTALVATFFFALSPWHIQFSRGAFEANAALFFILGGVLFFFLGLRRLRFLIVSAVLFVLSLYAYHSARLFVPLLLLGFAFMYRRELWQKRKDVLVAGVIGFLILVPLLGVLFSPEGVKRFQGVSKFSDTTPVLARSVSQEQDDLINGFVFGKIFHNRRMVFVSDFIYGYISHFSPNYLFMEGDSARHHAPGMGLLYLFEMPFILWGFYTVVRGGGRLRGVLLWWFFMAPVVAAPTIDVPHAIRTLVFLPTFQIFTAVGLLRFWDYLKQRTKFLRLGVVILMCGVFGFNFAYYLNSYFVQMPYEYSEYWQYGYRDMVRYVGNVANQYDRVVVSKKLEQPQIFFLYYLPLSPQEYLSKGGTRFDLGPYDYAFRNYTFGWSPKDSVKYEGEKVLYVGMPEEFETSLGNPKTFYRINGTPGIVVSEHYK